MRIAFGMNFDSHIGFSSNDMFCAPMVGPMGFLGLLETYLGLAAPDVSATRRLTSYWGHLRVHDDGNRFYSRSIKVDGVGTAAKLLAWRDEWAMGGWTGERPEGAPKLLIDMAAVEQSARLLLPAGQSERLSAIKAKLAKATTPNIPITSVSLIDPIDLYPNAWRKVLELLPAVTQWQPQISGKGQLRTLQILANQAVSDQRVTETLTTVTDASISVFQPESRAVAEHWISALCASDSGTERLIVCESSGDSLDTTLAATGSVRSGFDSASAFRPAMQAIGLALQMCWAPLDIGRLVEFLMHPVGPFSRHARAELAAALGQQPGIGGPAWIAAKEAMASQEGGDNLLEEISFWLEGERWSRDAGAPVDALVSRADRLRDALTRRLTVDPSTSPIFSPAIEQCRAVAESFAEFERQKVLHLTPRDIEQIIQHATSGGKNPAAVAQIGCIRSAASAEACIEPADEVLWWMPTTPALPKSHPWSAIEMRALRDIGVVLRDPERELMYIAQVWLRPLLAARKHFVLVLPPLGEEVHPFYQLIHKLVPDLAQTSKNVKFDPDGRYEGTLLTPVEPCTLPATPGIIDLARALELPNKPQSYTSLNELFNDPSLYALKRIARLRASAAISAEEDNRLLGTLAHRTFELLFRHEEVLTWSDAQAIEWFDGQIDLLLQTEGAPLLMLGAGVSEQRFKSICKSAIISLLGYLRDAGAVAVRTEVPFTGTLGEISLTGNVDLVVSLPNHRTAALDVKWASEKRYEAKLSAGQHVQLAIYSKLIEQAFGVAPVALGYFIVQSGTLYISVPDVFPTARVRIPKNAASAFELQQQTAESWKWRKSQWQAGLISVASGMANEDEPPPGTLPIEALGNWNFDHLVLLGGWEQ